MIQMMCESKSGYKASLAGFGIKFSVRAENPKSKYTNPANPVLNFCMQKLAAPLCVEFGSAVLVRTYIFCHYPGIAHLCSRCMVTAQCV